MTGVMMRTWIVYVTMTPMIGAAIGFIDIRSIPNCLDSSSVRCNTAFPMNAVRSLDPVLVVDDNRDGREMLVEYLQFKGFNVREASDGATALDLAAAIRPRVILMDLAMVELDGFETTRRLRENARTKDAIIVAVTARAFAADRNEAHRAGCDGFISKPFDLATLADYVDRILRQGRCACDTAFTG
jgi:two-component system cell cycle response regulator DivK